MGDNEFDAMMQVSPTVALTYYWLFIVMMLLVMLNILLAILIDAYESVMDELIREPKDVQPSRFPWHYLQTQVCCCHRYLLHCCGGCGGGVPGTFGYCAQHIDTMGLESVTEAQLRSWGMPVAVSQEVFEIASEYSSRKAEAAEEQAEDGQ